MRLAGHLKWPSVSWGLERISSRELTEWQAFERIEPWGDEWRQVGMICSTQATLAGRKDCPPERFMPIEHKPAQQTAADMEAQCWAFVRQASNSQAEIRVKQ